MVSECIVGIGVCRVAVYVGNGDNVSMGIFLIDEIPESIFLRCNSIHTIGVDIFHDRILFTNHITAVPGKGGGIAMAGLFRISQAVYVIGICPLIAILMIRGQLIQLVILIPPKLHIIGIRIVLALIEVINVRQIPGMIIGVILIPGIMRFLCHTVCKVIEVGGGICAGFGQPVASGIVGIGGSCSVDGFCRQFAAVRILIRFLHLADCFAVGQAVTVQGIGIGIALECSVLVADRQICFVIRNLRGDAAALFLQEVPVLPVNAAGVSRL